MPPDLFNRRATIVTFVISCLFAAVMAKSVWLTYFVPEQKVYEHRRQILRGVIYDKRGIELAVSQEAFDIGIHPKKVKNSQELAELSAPVLGLTAGQIKKKTATTKRFFYVKRSVTRRQAKLMQGLELPGVDVHRVVSRVYPNNSLAASVLGMTNIDNRGLEGLEKTMESILNRPADDANVRGYNIHLTLDSLVQFKTESILNEVMTDLGAQKAMAMIMETATGKILAMASLPSYNPNKFNQFPAANRQNFNIRHNYEPGSTMKPFIAAALMSEKTIPPDKKFICKGKLEWKDMSVKCTSAHGALNLRDILRFSCNAGMIQAAASLNLMTIRSYLLEFGFGRPTGVNLFGETAGYFPAAKHWQPSKHIFVPIGQSISVTPLQLLQAFNTIANGGLMVRPQLVSHHSNSFGEEENKKPSENVRQVLSPAVASELMGYLQAVVEENGTGRRAKIMGMHMAGKTGTGQIAGKTGYIPNAYTASFMVAFPMPKPRYTAVLIFDRPQKITSGGGAAAPTLRKIIQNVLPLLQENQTIATQPLPQLNFSLAKLNKSHVPNLIGKSAREAVQILHYLNIPYKASGYGYVKSQSVPPGVPLPLKAPLGLKLEAP